MVSHGDLGGVDIPQSKQRNTIHLANHLRGRARGRTLPIKYFLPFSSDTIMGVEIYPWS